MASELDRIITISPKCYQGRLRGATDQIILQATAPNTAPGIALSKNLFVQQTLEILTVAILGKRRGEFLQLLRINPLLPKRDLFRAGHFKPLTVLKRGDETTGFQQRVVGAGIQPRIASAHDLYRQLAPLHVDTVKVGNLKLASWRWLDAFGDVHYVLVIEVKTGHRVVRLRLKRLLFEADRLALCIELYNAVTLRIVYVIGENTRAILTQHRACQQLIEMMAVIDVIAQHQGRQVIADELFADDECLRQSIRR